MIETASLSRLPQAKNTPNKCHGLRHPPLEKVFLLNSSLISSVSIVATRRDGKDRGSGRSWWLLTCSKVTKALKLRNEQPVGDDDSQLWIGDVFTSFCHLGHQKLVKYGQGTVELEI